MRLILLGTKAGPRVTLDRMGPGQVIITDDATVLVDCAEGIPHQMLRAGVDPATIDGLFITHHHSDHNAGYGNVIMAGWANGRTGPLRAYGPPPLTEMTRAAFDLNRTDIEIRTADEGRPDIRKLVDCREVTGTGHVADFGRLSVTSAIVHHPPVHPAFAFRFDHGGSSVVISGDTTACDGLIELARGADVLVHEVISVDWAGARTGNFDQEAMKQHLVRSHTPVTEVGKVAAAAGVRRLVLSHLSPSSTDIPDSRWIDVVARDFDGDIVVGKDLMVVDV